jgi:hypothetical protein
MTKVYEEYAVLTAQIKALTDKKTELNIQILKDLVEQNIDDLTTSVGKFTIAKLKTWHYTDKVEKLEEEYKALKASEESTGDATFEEKPSLRFTQVKF